MTEKEIKFFKINKIKVISSFKTSKVINVTHYDNKYKINEFLNSEIEKIKLN